VTAAEVKVFSTIGVQAALEELAPKFEQATGNKLNITWATAAILVKRVQAGETADLMVLTKQSLDALTNDNKATAGNDAAFASSGMAVVVKKGAPKPEISTPDAFKQALINAKTIAYSDPASGGASGVYFAKLLERMGIAAAGIGADSQQSEAANALIRFLHTPEAQSVFKAKGLKPADAPKGT
jgi:molybdate transport system substrate-binding protein